jgi:hypothetical protein
VGFYGTKGIGWGLTMDVATGGAGVRVAPASTVGLYVNAGASGSAAALYYGLFVYGATTWGLYVQGNAYTSGRSRDGKIRSNLANSNSVNTTSAGWVDMPNMSITITSPDIGAYFQVQAQINGVQGTGVANVRGYFRLLVDGGEWERTAHEFHNAGWELRGVTLGRVAFLAAGSHTITVQWLTQGGGTLTCCWYGDLRQITVVEL